MNDFAHPDTFAQDDIYLINALTGAVVEQHGSKSVTAQLVKGGQHVQARLGYVYLTGMQARCLVRKLDQSRFGILTRELPSNAQVQGMDSCMGAL